jgi:hypothetical protein
VPKLRVLSGHDTTIFMLLSALGVRDGDWPPYASCVTIEVLPAAGAASNEDVFIRVLYNSRALPLRALFGLPPHYEGPPSAGAARELELGGLATAASGALYGATPPSASAHTGAGLRHAAGPHELVNLQEWLASLRRLIPTDLQRECENVPDSIRDAADAARRRAKPSDPIAVDLPAEVVFRKPTQ